jgi:hypothetical protein
MMVSSAIGIQNNSRTRQTAGAEAPRLHLKIFIVYWPDGSYHDNPPDGGVLCVLMKILSWTIHLSYANFLHFLFQPGIGLLCE